MTTDTTAGGAAGTGSPGNGGLRVLHRVVMPVDRDQDILKLYIEGNIVRTRDAGDGPDGAHALESGAEPVPGAASGEGAATAEFQPAEHWDGSDRDDEDDGPGGASDRRRVVVPAGRRVSFLTYFNAFPASYWRRWTRLEEVVLRVRVRGDAKILVYRSNSKGHSQRLESHEVHAAATEERLFSTDHKTTATTIQRMTFFARSFKALPRDGRPGRKHLFRPYYIPKLLASK